MGASDELSVAETELSEPQAARAARGETETHRRLKRLALAWAQANGLAIGACEVRVPRCGYRADAAAAARGAEGRRTAVFECKQARADLLKDAHAEEETKRRLAELLERRSKLEALLAVHRPDLRRGEALWPEFDTWDFSGLEHAAYRSVLTELATVQARVVKGTKFAKMLRYRCADFLYLVVEDNIFAEAEIPAGWGLLVRRGETDELVLKRAPVALAAAEAQRLALLEEIALAATRVVSRALGIPRGSGDGCGAPNGSGRWR
ncbi:hypothetical protein K0B96_03515 [Horticoccus luteus]|uniref:Uncharacterized protein n=1 Tax=Horticoccus luteus TaxID=2862869 RepID=A0A8F9TX15_9BACT|nr:hypothetical protein [Horticoccus luteus]QYM79700.1 hypothetical protein K0B96_03515 [Horticoccus luteus]